MIAPVFNQVNVFDKVCLIDADKLKHLVTHDVYSHYNGSVPLDVDRKYINELTKNRLSSIYDLFTAKDYVFCFSGRSSETFRNSIAFEKKYKGNRTDSTFYEQKIIHQTFVVEYIMRTSYTLLYEDLEADDLLSALQNEKTFILSNDKDLKQIPGNHFDTSTMKMIQISYEEAVYNLSMQLLCGDSTDNIQGIPQIGPTKAKAILNDLSPKRYFNSILVKYQIKYGVINGTDSFAENWMLVKLRQNRGEHFIEKYKEAFNLINALCQNC